MKRGWDDRLHASYQLYVAVRRHLWRHVVHEHQGCISTAGRHLWWHMEGGTPPAFARSPKHSCAGGCFGRHVGRLAIYSRRCARIRSAWPAGWPPAPRVPIKLGVGNGAMGLDHVLGRTCLGSFRDFLDIALQSRERGRIDWDGHALSGRYESYWAVVGRDTLACPVRIYEQLRAPYQFRAVLDEHRADRAHHLVSSKSPRLKRSGLICHQRAFGQLERNWIKSASTPQVENMPRMRTTNRGS